MKKYLTIALAIVAACACDKAFNEPETIIEKEDSGVTLFSGSIPVTKTTLGEKDGTSFKVLWEEGDVLSVSASGTPLGTATLVSGVGENNGVFSLPGTIADGTVVNLVYAGNEIAAEQSKASTSRSFKGAGSATATVSGGAANFTLAQNAAVVRISVASSTLSGATLNAVILRSEGADLNADGGDYVRVALTDTPTLGSTAKEIIFTTKSVNLSGSEIDIAFELTNGTENYTLPVGFKGKLLDTEKVNSFVFNDLSESQCVGWYEPHDTRLMPGPGYAYGEANCYFIQCKNGTTYTGATYTPNDNIPSEVSVSYKARGDFRKVGKPVGVSFTWMKLGATDTTTGTGTGNVYTMRTINYSASGVNPGNFTITPNPDDYKVTVANTGAYAGAPILLMVKDGTILWAWSFWNIAADGTSIVPVQITPKSPKKIITMDIGQATRNADAWGANSDALYRTVYRYQWGRPMPVFWNSVTTLDFPGVQAGNIPAIVGPVSIEESMQHPASIIVASTESGKTLTDWLDTPCADLWGNNSATTSNAGTKSVFDPCPKGYRICDRNTLLNIVRTYATDWARTSGTGYFFNTCNYPSGSSDCWSRSGCYNGTTNTSSGKTAIGGFSPNLSGSNNGFWWTNLCQGNTDEKPSAYVAVNQDNLAFNDNFQYKSWAASVRCEVDTDNR